MSLYLVLATNDLRSAVSITCTSSYMPFNRVAVVSYHGSADELARRLNLGRTGGPGALVGSAKRAVTVGAGLMLVLLFVGVLT